MQISIIKNRSFWILVASIILIIFIYQTWPWRDWIFTGNFWKWFSWLSALDDLAIFELRNNLTGILFILPIVFSAIKFKWPVTLIVSLISLIYSLTFVALWGDIASILTNTTILLLPTLIIIAINIEMELRRKDRNVYIEREEERRLYAKKLLETQENERRRIAQELHDDTIQTLLVISKGAQALTKCEDIEKIRNMAINIKEISLNAVEEVRRLSLDLRPFVLDDLGLISAIRWLAEHLEEEGKIKTRIETTGAVHNLPSQTEVVLFRVIQEALNNIKRHSQATNTVIQLEYSDVSLKLRISDDGQGFIPPKKLSNLVDKGKLGLAGMQERIDLIGASLTIDSELGRGTTIIMDIPFS